MAAGHREAARSVLDGGEHGARLKQAGATAEDTTMRDTSLLQLALGVAPPWTVTGSEFDAEARRLDIHIDFAAGSRFACPSCGAADCPAHDTEQMTLAASQLLPAPGLSARPCAACALRHAAGSRRSACPGRARAAASPCCSRRWSWPGLSDAGQRRGPTGRRA